MGRPCNHGHVTGHQGTSVGRVANWEGHRCVSNAFPHKWYVLGPHRNRGPGCHILSTQPLNRIPQHGANCGRVLFCFYGSPCKQPPKRKTGTSHCGHLVPFGTSPFSGGPTARTEVAGHQQHNTGGGGSAAARKALSSQSHASSYSRICVSVHFPLADAKGPYQYRKYVKVLRLPHNQRGKALKR